MIKSDTGKDRTLAPEELMNAAREASKNAYAPYSGLFVGAALVSAKGDVYSGCNVENVSYSIVSCAERNAIAAAVRAEGESFKLKALAVTAHARSGQAMPITPCGACRQAIAEFGRDALVILSTPQAMIEHRSIAQLLPDMFSTVAEEK